MPRLKSEGTSLKFMPRTKGLVIVVRCNEVLLVEVFFHLFFCYWGKENRSFSFEDLVMYRLVISRVPLYPVSS